MLNTAPVVIGGSAAVVLGGAGTVWLLLRGRGRRNPGIPGAREKQLQSGFVTRLGSLLVNWIADRGRRLTPSARLAILERKVRLAGSRAFWSLDRVLAAKLLLALAAGLAGFWYGGRRSPLAMVITGLVATAAGYLVPDLILWGRAKERQEIIRRELPEVLDQLTVCVESGLGFDAALQRVGAKGAGPLSEELRRTLSELSVGVPRGDALGNLVARTDVDELRRFVVAVRQADEFGLPIARVLRVQSKQLRVRRRLAAEERAMKMPVKIVFPLVLCIFPALFVVLLGPAVIRVMRALF
jgi:tight adherence protein C